MFDEIGSSYIDAGLRGLLAKKGKIDSGKGEMHCTLRLDTTMLA